jgi:Archaeal/vacuolar-type H+-ATPase subunit E
MTNIDQVFLYMKDEIQRTARSEKKVILDEVKTLEEQAYLSMKQEAKKDADLRLKQELEDMQSKASIEISESHIERTKKLIEKRESYVSEVFQSSEDKLIEFTSSKKYREFMLKKANKIINMIEDECILYVLEKDLSLKDELLSLSNKIIDIKVSQDFKIGGMIGMNPDSSLIIDETLDFALENQREWFTQNSGLMIK